MLANECFSLKKKLKIMLVLPKYAKNYANTIDKSRSSEPHMLNKDLTLFMKRLFSSTQKSSTSERKALLEGRKTGKRNQQLLSYTGYRWYTFAISNINFPYYYSNGSFKEIVPFIIKYCNNRTPQLRTWILRTR